MLPLGRRERADRAALPLPAAAPSQPPLVPRGLAIAGGFSWRILAVLALAAVVLWLVSQLRIVVVPLLIAALLTALLLPTVNALVRARWPRGLAVAFSVVMLIVIVTALIWISVAQIREGYPFLQERALAFWNQAREWVLSLPFGVSEADIENFGTNILGTLREDFSSVLQGALSVGSSVGHFLTGALLALFSLIFLLLDGRRIWTWITGLFPRNARPALDGAGKAGWVTLGNFVRVQLVVAAIDAVGIGLGAWIMGLFFGGMPLVVPLAILVFLGSFIPLIGAIATGALAVFVALVTLGVWPAVIMLGIVLLVQQVESHVLQPLIMGTAVKVHPLAVVLAVASGSIVAGIAGALFAVPIVASANVFVKTIATGSWRRNPEPEVKDVVQ